MSLDFTVPVASRSERTARSPMERLARAAGARFERRGGWNVAVAYGADIAVEAARMSDTVGFCDRSALAKLDIQADPDVLAELVGRVAGGLTLELGRASPTPDGASWWCPITPSRLLVLSEPTSGSDVRAAVDGAAAEAGERLLTVADVSCGLAAMTLVGPGANELLARFCAIDVRPAVTPVAAFRPGSVARTPGYLLREDEDRLLVLVGWALGAYLWEVVADAAAHLGGGPVGSKALGVASGGAASGGVGADGPLATDAPAGVGEGTANA
jgi:heterotetrameric sarcosine oxidase gamma subunit